MAFETVKEQISEFGRQAYDNYWQTVDQVTAAADRWTDGAIAVIPGFPEQGTEWVKNMREQRNKGVAEMKQNMNKMTEPVMNFQSPREFPKRAVDFYQESVNRVIEQMTTLQARGTEATRKMADQIPEPGRQWLNYCNEVAESGVERMKSALKGDVSAMFQFPGARAGTEAESENAGKAAKKTAAKAEKK